MLLEVPLTRPENYQGDVLIMEGDGVQKHYE